MRSSEPSLPMRSMCQGYGYLRRYMPYKGYHLATCYP